LLFRSWY